MFCADIMDSMVSVIDDHVATVLKNSCPDVADTAQLPPPRTPSAANNKWDAAARAGMQSQQRARSRQNSRVG